MAVQFFLGQRIVSPFATSVRGRQSIAVNQPTGGGSDYPFIFKSDLSSIIADAYLYTCADCRALEKPFSIKWLYGFGTDPVPSAISPVHDQDILINDANGVEVFNSLNADSYSSQDWGDRLRVIEWKSDSPEAVLRIVQHIAIPQGSDPENFPTYYEPDFSELDDRIVESVAPRLSSLGVVSGDQLLESIKLAGGYNIKITAIPGTPVNGGRLSTDLVIDAKPGLGLGKFVAECGEEDPPIRNINGITGDKNGTSR
jgi:hypothetical protein